MLKEKGNEMLDGLDTYLTFIKENFAAHYANRTDDVAKSMVENFNNGLRVDEGSKYLKVVTHSGSAHTFICKKDAGKFKKGDILMAASWNAPARNFARGNVIAKEFGSINCYGA